MFIRNTAFSSFSDEVAEQYMREIVGIAKIDTYWSDDDLPAPGRSGGVEGIDKGKGQVAHAKEGWNIMYVRLRGLAVKPPSRSIE